MANIKITDLTAYGNPTSTDVLPIVDVGADVTKKVSIADLFKNAASGTESLPGIAFDDDPNTGISRPDADELAISTAGTERLRITSAGLVGIGTTSPQQPLHIKNAVSSACRLVLENTGSSSPTSTQVWSQNNDLVFDANGGEAARIDSSGRLLVGTSNTPVSSTVVLQGRSEVTTGEAILRLCRGQNTPADAAVLGDLSFGDSNNGDAARIFAQRDGGTWTSASSRPTRLVFSTTADGASSPTERMRIKSNGTINFSNVSVYADNAAAKTGGLVDGDVYRTSTGNLKIVYS